MNNRATTILALSLLLLSPIAAQARTKDSGLTPYMQNFEGLNQANASALSADGWLVYGNVFSPDHSTYYYGYGSYPAPNNSGGFCGIDFVTGAPAEGAQDMVVYSDYNNSGAMSAGDQVEANVYQQQTIGAADVGHTWEFRYDAKLGNLVAPSTAAAFIKTLDPNNGYATVVFLTNNSTTLPGDTWTQGLAIDLTITPALVGQLLQFGFMATASNYVGSGVFYDNISFQNLSATPTHSESWGQLKSIYR